MNKKELRTLKLTYKEQYLQYRLFPNNDNKNKLTGMQLMLNNLNVNYIPWENEVILGNSKYLHETWLDICNFIKADELKISEFYIQYIKDELFIHSESKKQLEARINVINTFEEKLQKTKQLLAFTC